MKKIISMLLALVMCCGLLVGCSSKPKGMNEELYSCGVKAVEIIDSYFESELTASEAEEKAKALVESTELIETEEKSAEWYVQMNIAMLEQTFGYLLSEEDSEEHMDSIMAELKLCKKALKMDLNMK